MDGEGRSRKPSGKMMGMGLLLIVGIIIGIFVSPFLDPIIQPERTSVLNNIQDIQAQNTLLKEQVDCLVNGINQENGIVTIENCT